MTWLPDTTVTINGVDFSGRTLEGVKVVRGRSQIYEEPRASYCIVELIDLTGDGLAVRPLDRMRVDIKDSNGQPVRVFTGTVSDTGERIFDTGVESGTPGTFTTVIATGALARLNRRQVAYDGRPEELEGDRIAALITEALAAPWEETGGTWATVAEADTTWGDFDSGLDLDLIDQPGVFDIAALDASPAGYNPLGQSYQAALSGRGTLFDTAAGFVAYKDVNARRTAAEQDGYLPILPAMINARNLNVKSSQAQVTNRVTVNYDGGSIVATDTASLFDYGLLSYELDTILADQSQAEAFALDYLEDHARPVATVDGIVIRLDNLTDTQRDNVLDLTIGSPIRLEGGSVIPGFVEGLEFQIDRARAELRISMSDAALSLGSTQWNNVDPSLAWEDVSATLTWINASEVGT